MIVVKQPDNTLCVVYQPEHAAASGDLALRWRRPDAIPERIWPRFLEAVRWHDEGWREAENWPAVDERGRPHTFKSLPADEHVAIWRNGIARLEVQDEYAMLLVALHARWLYTHIASDTERADATAQAFLRDLDQRIDTILQYLQRKAEPALREAIKPDNLTVARRLLGLMDALSLMLVGGLPCSGFNEPVAFGSEASALRIEAAQEGVVVDPWPFEGGAFRVRVGAREIPHRRYRGPADLSATLRRAEAVHLTCHVQPAG